MTDVIELAKQSGIRWDAESDCSEWRLRRSEIDALVALVRNAAIDEAAQKCRATAASIWRCHDDGCNEIGTTVCSNIEASIKATKVNP